MLTDFVRNKQLNCIYAVISNQHCSTVEFYLEVIVSTYVDKYHNNHLIGSDTLIYNDHELYFLKEN